MTASERRQLRRSIILGVGLTVLTVLADWLGYLQAPENWLYDKRALLCQQFAPPPTDKLVHLDIDDAALEERIGKWPWSRDKEAAIVDELRLAGAKALALDIMFPHPIHILGGLRETTNADAPASAPASGPATNPADPPDEDAIFADSLKRFGRVTLAISLDFFDLTPNTPRHARLLDLLTHNLELTKEDVDATLRKAGMGASTEDEYFATLREAVAARVANEDPPGIEFYPVIRGQLLPTLSKFHNSVPERLLETEYYRYLALRAMQPLLPPVPPTAPALRHAVGEKAPIPELSNAVASVGCADKMPGPDGVVRFLPIWVEDRGRMVPQLGFSLACLYLGCDPRKVQVEGDSVIIPREDGPPIVIPTWQRYGDDGKLIGTLVDIPMFGVRNRWDTMYDYPSHESRKAHMPIGSVWEVVETRQRLRANNHVADIAMSALLREVDPSAADAFKAQPLDPDNTAARLTMIREKLNDAFLKPQIEAYEKLSPKEKEADPSRASMEVITSIWDQLPALVRQTELLEQQLVQRQAGLSKEVRDKAVIIGWTATGNIDYSPTAIHSQSPGVVTHGAIFNAILTNWLFTRSPKYVSYIIAAIGGLMLTGIVSLTSPWKGLGVSLSFIAVYLFINGELLYGYNRHILNMAGPIIAALFVWSHLTAARFIAEAVEHRRIRERFRAYKDPILVNYIIEHPEITRLQSEVRLMTVGFTDLQGFTSLSETLREKAVEIVGRYMTRMVPIIRKHKGLINTFMGDGIMFSYGAPIANPNHETDAALTILEMQETMKTFNAELRSEGYPELNMRAGVNTGDVIVGDAGPEDASDYTCLGDATNLAARLESANKATGTKNLIADTTAQGLNGRFLIRPIAKLRVMGKQQSILTWELIAEISKATDQQRAIAAVTQTMFDHYTAGRFTQAVAAAAEMDQLCGHSKLAALYRDRCQEYLTNPPTEFEGNIVLEKK